jgi:ribulose-5-phosphate 4-epimerase/fuculose-1-phosphate aldolase
MRDSLRRCAIAALALTPLLAQAPRGTNAGGSAEPGRPSKLEQIRDLVLANQILANEGVLDAYGHVSVRDAQNPNHFFLARHIPAITVTAEDIVEYDFDANSIDPANNAVGYTERFIHSEIYRARPDVMAVVHTHASDLIPFADTATPLRPMYHMAGFLGDRVPVFDIRKTAGMTDMLIRTPALGKALAEALGNASAALMRGHGAVVVAPSLHMAAGRAYYMALNARLEWQALLVGSPILYLDPEEARKSSAQDGYERFWLAGKRKQENK